MKLLLFDAGPIISLTTNNLLWLAPKLKEKFGGEFGITQGVHGELVKKPLETKKFKFEAIQVQRMVEQKTFSLLDSPKIKASAENLQTIANSIYRVRRQPLTIVQLGEMQTIAAALQFNASAIVCDERITRTLLEDPHALRDLYERRLHERVELDENALHRFQTIVKGIRIIRSVELVTIAYELGLLNDFLVNVPNIRRELLESILWGVKLHGAAVSEDEITQIVKNELKR